MDAQIDLFFLSSFYDIVSDAMRSISSQVDQRNEEALCLPMRLHRMSPSKKSWRPMWRSFDGCANRSLSSFLLSFCYDIVLDGIRSFNSQVDQRIEEALCLSLCSYTGCLFFQEKLHIRRRSSRLSCKFPRSLPTPKSITAKM
jgi:hypothetical protein